MCICIHLNDSDHPLPSISEKLFRQCLFLIRIGLMMTQYLKTLGSIPCTLGMNATESVICR